MGPGSEAVSRTGRNVTRAGERTRGSEGAGLRAGISALRGRYGGGWPLAEKFLNFIIGEVVQHHRAIADRAVSGGDAKPF